MASSPTEGRTPAGGKRRGGPRGGWTTRLVPEHLPGTLHGRPGLRSHSASHRVVSGQAQLLKAIVSTTCSSLLRSRCRRACSSFSKAARISSLYLVM